MNTSYHADSRDLCRVDPLARTGRLGGGIAADIRRRLPHYASDYRTGLNSKVLASVAFLFFACLANAIAFGGLTSLLTGGEIARSR